MNHPVLDERWGEEVGGPPTQPSQAGGGREAQIGFTSPLSVWRVRDSRQKRWIYKEGLSRRRLDANTPSLSLG